MSKTSKFENTLGKIITWVLVVLLVLGLAGVIAYFVAKDEGISFYVDFNGEKYYSGVTEDKLSLGTGSKYSFEVKSLTGQSVDYSVSILSNEKHNFTFTYGNEFYDFYNKDDTAKNDYSNVFGLETDINGFSITLPKDITVKDIVELKYGSEIHLQEELDNDMAYFVINVTSGESTLSFFLYMDVKTTGIGLSDTAIVF